MSDRIRLDYGRMFGSGGVGLDPALLSEFEARFRDTHRDTEVRREARELGFFELPYADDVVSDVLAFADDRSDLDAVVVLGIGGSALGTIALREALLPPRWNELDVTARQGRPRLYVLDNVDPETIAPLLDRLDLRRTLFNVVSKSGTTAETMAQLSIVRDRLGALGGDVARSNLVFTTDPESGTLRRIARDEGIAAFAVPPNVGGRFSVLSAVGLLPLALTGVDIAGLLAGARDMDARCRSMELAENPAGLFAVLQYLADTRLGARIHVMMSYSDRLYGIADWFRQLWAESLGKRFDRAGNEVRTGPTPVKALGATDQHSQVQLYAEGPRDKTVTFLTLRDFERDLTIPGAYPEHDSLAYLAGHTLGELLRAEQQATAAALSHAGCMNMEIELPRVSAHALGQLLMMLQVATVYAGALYGVNPLDQPGVELGKQLTYGLMGRPGYPRPELGVTDDRWVCS